MTALLNYTPHTVSIAVGGSETTDPVRVLNLPSVGVARCSEERSAAGVLTVNEVDIPVVHVIYGSVSGLPAPQEATFYIVSLVVKQRLPERHDLLSPGDLIRGGDGRVVGCRDLCL